MPSVETVRIPEQSHKEEPMTPEQAIRILERECQYPDALPGAEDPNAEKFKAICTLKEFFGMEQEGVVDDRPE